MKLKVNFENEKVNSTTESGLFCHDRKRMKEKKERKIFQKIFFENFESFDESLFKSKFKANNQIVLVADNI